ncbi:MAG: hypothetical protein AAF204_03675, partial [Pseudomonadota bacterium]
MSAFKRFGLAERGHSRAIELLPFSEESFADFLASTFARERIWLENSNFSAKPDTFTQSLSRENKPNRIYIGLNRSSGSHEDPLEDKYSIASWYNDLRSLPRRRMLKLSERVSLTEE